jgi:hypothetical protein
MLANTAVIERRRWTRSALMLLLLVPPAGILLLNSAFWLTVTVPFPVLERVLMIAAPIGVVAITFLAVRRFSWGFAWRAWVVGAWFGALAASFFFIFGFASSAL